MVHIIVFPRISLVKTADQYDYMVSTDIKKTDLRVNYKYREAQITVHLNIEAHALTFDCSMRICKFRRGVFCAKLYVIYIECVIEDNYLLHLKDK